MTASSPTVWRTLLLTSAALIAFAANSVLGRLALVEGAADAAGYTLIRLASGAAMLYIILRLRGVKGSPLRFGSWTGAGFLFLYAIAFSYAYISVETGAGAVILFGAVQLTMILYSLVMGERLHLTETAGLAIAFGGFLYLMLPGASAPPLGGFLLMALAGVAWGGYTLRGKGSATPLADTASNFIRTLPLLLVLGIVAISQLEVTWYGAGLAVASGAITSGLGYSIWYAALAGLSATQAGVVQLLVPVIASLGGVLFVSEPLTSQLIIASLLILGGIGLVMNGRYRQLKKSRA